LTKQLNSLHIPNLTSKTISELGKAKHDLEERTHQLQELVRQSNIKFNEIVKVNETLKEKIDFLQDLATSLSVRNDELEKKNQNLETQKIENDKLANDLKKNLEKVVLKEKELELQRDHLERQIIEKTDELIKSQKLAIIGELASRMAHDLRNPLSTIKNVIELMEAKPKLQVIDKITYYGMLRKAIDRITHHVDDILEYCKTTQLTMQTCNITKLISNVIEYNNFPPDIKINIENVDVKVNVDLRKMEAVFTNLLLNSIQALNDHGTINVRILDNGPHAIVAVEDSGPGIPENILQKIFDPMFTTKQTGTGLGLSICKKIVEQHGGSIIVKNDPTTFVVRIPKNF
jgi:two-component system sensor histidine kinase HydH